MRLPLDVIVDEEQARVMLAEVGFDRAHITQILSQCEARMNHEHRSTTLQWQPTTPSDASHSSSSTHAQQDRRQPYAGATHIAQQILQQASFMASVLDSRNLLPESGCDDKSISRTRLSETQMSESGTEPHSGCSSPRAVCTADALARPIPRHMQTTVHGGICSTNASPPADNAQRWKECSDHVTCGVNWGDDNSPEDRHTPSTGQEPHYLQGVVGDRHRERIDRKFQQLELEKKCQNASKTNTEDASACCSPAVDLRKSVPSVQTPYSELPSVEALSLHPAPLQSPVILRDSRQLAPTTFIRLSTEGAPTEDASEGRTKLR